MQTQVIETTHPDALPRALSVLQAGGLIAFPTDTVYGLAALPFKEETVDRLYVAKGRNSLKAIAILVGNTADLPLVTPLMTPLAERLAESFWPGPMTLIVQGGPALPANISPTLTIGVRMPDHPVALALLRKIGPLAVTSANLSGGENALTAQHVLAQLGGKIHLILDGGSVPGGMPSTVVDCTASEPVIVRTGPITLEMLQAALLSMPLVNQGL